MTNEDGSVLVVALIILVLLTLIGMSATTTSEIEIRIAGNESTHTRNLYFAEGAALEFAQVLQNWDDKSTSALKINRVRPDNIYDLANWPSNSYVSHIGTAESKARAICVYDGVFPGASLDMGKSRVHDYIIYGAWYDPDRPNQGRAIVMIGYRKAFSGKPLLPMEEIPLK